MVNRKNKSRKNKSRKNRLGKYVKKGGGFGYENTDADIVVGVKGTYFPTNKFVNSGINSDTNHNSSCQNGGYKKRKQIKKTRKNKKNNKSKKNKKRKNIKTYKKNKNMRKMKGGNLMKQSIFSNTYTLDPKLDHIALANPMNHKTFVNCHDNYNHFQATQK
tara:strand:+ start:3567 stop:4049 length:483 start_codon:yes stop_codon:yes gene_type:complete